MIMGKESIIFVGLFTVILSAVILLLSYSSSGQELNQYVKIEVQQGDTLWSIADQVTDKKKMNKQDFIEWVADKNYLQTTDIQPGDELVIPLKKKHQDAYELATVR
ncbi:cell division suppressor protein YneA [Bacillus vallismortis]|uniref:Cell division suppressor protein YneA n=1 Tax=Bacillus vallismortis TaxID=72361 RepID=A0AAP3FU57_BACVA|nr:cell division suppressor protein YneA [Bacillus vallismortis]MCI3985986.1 cell division suppressor protein YneA [Bacillus vallismortis]MCI4137055.1 cell division suppressor protein YneA [Bacillus vallismortis]MCY7891755.1 cell division suppressor protein YneA [Bacillus vallismortis]MCY7917892.1 cell division suppressor protein YneA [Bacillus vallismortis]MCY8316387.1 cell division suppressor protein YneA [Bacillus vallismortis]